MKNAVRGQSVLSFFLMDSQFFIIETIECCRICRSSKTAFDISTEKLVGEDVLLYEALEFVLCLKVDFEDGMSHHICARCCERLLESFLFKNQALEAYRIFCDQVSDTRIQNGDSTVVIKEDKETTEVSENPVDLSTDAVDHQKSNIDNVVLKPKEEKEFDITIDEMQDIFLENSNSPVQELQLLNVENKNALKEELGEESDTETKTSQSEVKTIRPKSKKPEFTLQDKSKKRQRAPPRKPRKRKHKCNICEKLFIEKANLIDHLRMHSNERNFTCQFCDKSFVQKCNYRTHLRVHTKERPYHCHLCPKTYTQGSQLKAHLRSHTCEKNYICPVCDKGFTTSGDLGRHKRIHDVSLQFKCEVCEKTFTQRTNLRHHQRNVHLKKYLSK